jgi:hypothetical protein
VLKSIKGIIVGIKKDLKTYKDILKKCAAGENPLPKGKESALISNVVNELKEKKWITIEGKVHSDSKVEITCDGLIGLAEINKTLLDNNPLYLTLLNIQSMLLIAFGATLTVLGKMLLM